MGRPRKNEICPICKEHGYLEKNPLRFVHYNSFTKKRDKKCYGAQQIWNSKNQDWILQKKNELEKMSPTDIQDFSLKLLRPNSGFDRREKKAIEEMVDDIAIEKNIPLYRYKKVSAEPPLPNLQGDSGLYYKIGDLSEHFFKIGKKLKKIQKDIYQLKPDEKISSECVNDLNEFETKLLIPLEKLLVPYNKKWTANWTEWIKIQLDNLSFGPNHTAKLHAKLTGEYGIYTNKEGKIILGPIKGSMTAKQITKNQQKVLDFAYQLIQANYIERALTNYYDNTSIDEEEYDGDGNLILRTNDEKYIQLPNENYKINRKEKNSYSDL